MRKFELDCKKYDIKYTHTINRVNVRRDVYSVSNNSFELTRNDQIIMVVVETTFDGL